MLFFIGEFVEDGIIYRIRLKIPDGFDDNEWLVTCHYNGSGTRVAYYHGANWGGDDRTESVVFGNVNYGCYHYANSVNACSWSCRCIDDFNLVGNPYPRAISADALIKQNISTQGTINQTIDGTLCFWTHQADVGAYVDFKTVLFEGRLYSIPWREEQELGKWWFRVAH
jgi:hypothetical protein